MNWYLTALKKYAVFTGRSRRREFWSFFLVNWAVAFIIGFIIGLRGAEASGGLGAFFMLYTLAIIVPSLAVGSRRLHDTGRTGWWLLLGLVPIIGQIALIVIFAQDGQPGENRFGPNPKALPSLS